MNADTVANRPPPGHLVTVEAPWRDHEARQKGWERMTVTLSQSIEALLTQSQVRAGHYLAAFRIADGELVDEHQSYSQDTHGRTADRSDPAVHRRDRSGYGRFLPHDKAALAAAVLNKVWA